MATSLVPGSADKASIAAPEQRPPQPIIPILIVSLPAACTPSPKGKAAVASTVPAEPRKNFRRVKDGRIMVALRITGLQMLNFPTVGS